MRHLGVALALGLSVPVAGCVQTRQFADLKFTPPQGDYKLLVMRPDVTVNTVTTGGMDQPRADWTEQARANLIAALAAQQAQRGGHVKILAHRNELAGVSEDEVADLERLHGAVGNGRLYLILYDATRSHYFDRAIGDFEAMTASARLRG